MTRQESTKPPERLELIMQANFFQNPSTALILNFKQASMHSNMVGPHLHRKPYNSSLIPHILSVISRKTS
jgi:hypothetical protein